MRIYFDWAFTVWHTRFYFDNLIELSADGSYLHSGSQGLLVAGW